MNSFNNTRSSNYLAALNAASIDDAADTLSVRCKFNFSYFTVQAHSQSFDQWTKDQLVKLLEKLKDYSRESLAHWRNSPVGKSGTVLAVYPAFPSRSDFQKPQHIPHQAEWARFRLESAVRLVGFVLPQNVNGTRHERTGHSFDCNTFYVVFLDANHRFYKTEPR